MQVNIPNPCSEDWNQMTPAAGGRHCAHCAKKVIDFTGWSAAEISFYLQMAAGAPTCGRVTADQLAAALPTPENYVLQVLRAPLPFLKQIAALIIFAIFIAAPFESQAIRKVKANKHAATSTTQEVPNRQEPEIVGMIAVKKPADTPAKCRQPIMGKVAMPPKANKPPMKDPQAQSPTSPQHIIGLVAMPAQKK